MTWSDAAREAAALARQHHGDKGMGAPGVTHGRAFQMLAVKSLVPTEGGQSVAKVARWMKAMQKGKPIDPVMVYDRGGGQFGVDDGHHRLRAARLLGMTKIPAVIE